jgi:hypothetical protein
LTVGDPLAVVLAAALLIAAALKLRDPAGSRAALGTFAASAALVGAVLRDRAGRLEQLHRFEVGAGRHVYDAKA